MTAQNPIEVVNTLIEVELTKSFITSTRDMSADGLKDYTDEQIVEALAEDILRRYFNTEYFDMDALGNLQLIS